MHYCTNCGAKLQSEQKFCVQCGADVTGKIAVKPKIIDHESQSISESTNYIDSSRSETRKTTSTYKRIKAKMRSITKVFVLIFIFILVFLIVGALVTIPFTGDPTNPNALSVIIGLVVAFFVMRAIDNHI